MKTIIKLDILAQNIGKTITDIAQETGLNRNTITAIYHNKVDGIKFDTLEKICETYNVSISDILEFEKIKTNEEYRQTSTNIYKQEGEIVPFTSWPFGIQASALRPDLFHKTYEVVWGYWQKNYGYGYWDLDLLNKLATSVYERYKEPRAFDGLYDEYLKEAKNLEKLYLKYNQTDILNFPEGEFKEFYKQLREAYKGFWGTCLFIDSFDAGYDQSQINLLTSKYKFSTEEVNILTTPTEMTFNNERLFKVMSLIKDFKRQKKYDTVEQFVRFSESVKEYKKEYDYYKSNYAFVKHITDDEIVQEITQYLANEESLEGQFNDLKNYALEHKKAVGKVLKKYGLRENPFYFFQMLTYWREHRKKINLMGIHLLYDALAYLQQATGITVEYLKFISLDEVDAVLRGLINQTILQKRYEEGIFVSFDASGYQLIEGVEAQSLRNEFENKLKHEIEEKILRGQTASQGYAQGIARVILSQDDFDSFKDGEILVTSMTRPEYLPIMQKAAAFVTDEGGITCHAAIVAREMKKPCIIGTKSATHLIKTGDLVEVRANHGTVRILS